MQTRKTNRSGSLAKLLGALSLGALVSTGCTSQETQSEDPPASDSGSGAEHACGNGCGANGCGGSCGSGAKEDDDGE